LPGPLDEVNVEYWLRSLPEWKRIILALLAEGRQVTTKEAAMEAGVAVSTAYGWLRTLENNGVVESYRAGFTNRRVWRMPEAVRRRLQAELRRLEAGEPPRWPSLASLCRVLEEEQRLPAVNTVTAAMRSHAAFLYRRLCRRPPEPITTLPAWLFTR